MLYSDFSFVLIVLTMPAFSTYTHLLSSLRSHTTEQEKYKALVGLEWTLPFSLPEAVQGLLKQPVSTYRSPILLPLDVLFMLATHQAVPLRSPPFPLDALTRLFQEELVTSKSEAQSPQSSLGSHTESSPLPTYDLWLHAIVLAMKYGEGDLAARWLTQEVPLRASRLHVACTRRATAPPLHAQCPDLLDTLLSSPLSPSERLVLFRLLMKAGALETSHDATLLSYKSTWRCLERLEGACATYTLLEQHDDAGEDFLHRKKEVALQAEKLLQGLQECEGLFPLTQRFTASHTSIHVLWDKLHPLTDVGRKLWSLTIEAVPDMPPPFPTHALSCLLKNMTTTLARGNNAFHAPRQQKTSLRTLETLTFLVDTVFPTLCRQRSLLHTPSDKETACALMNAVAEGFVMLQHYQPDHVASHFARFSQQAPAYAAYPTSFQECWAWWCLKATASTPAAAPAVLDGASSDQKGAPDVEFMAQRLTHLPVSPDLPRSLLSFWIDAFGTPPELFTHVLSFLTWVKQQKTPAAQRCLEHLRHQVHATLHKPKHTRDSWSGPHIFDQREKSRLEALVLTLEGPALLPPQTVRRTRL